MIILSNYIPNILEKLCSKYILKYYILKISGHKYKYFQIPITKKKSNFPSSCTVLMFTTLD